MNPDLYDGPERRIEHNDDLRQEEVARQRPQLPQQQQAQAILPGNAGQFRENGIAEQDRGEEGPNEAPQVQGVEENHNEDGKAARNQQVLGGIVSDGENSSLQQSLNSTQTRHASIGSENETRKHFSNNSIVNQDLKPELRDGISSNLKPQVGINGESVSAHSGLQHPYGLPSHEAGPNQGLPPSGPPSDTVAAASTWSSAMHFYEAQMRDHAVAYASAAANAAWAAAQVAQAAADWAAQQQQQHPPLLASPLLPPQSPTLPTGMMLFPTFAADPSQPYPAPPHLAPPPHLMVGDTASFAHTGVQFMSSPTAENAMEVETFASPQQQTYNNAFQQQPASSYSQTNPRSFHRRKRQQHFPPGATQGKKDHYQQQQQYRHHGLTAPFVESHQQQAQQSSRGKVRRRHRGGGSDGDSSSSGSSFWQSQRTSSGAASGRGNFGGGGHHSKKKKILSDASLLGKTGVAALYEWCSKRQLTPTFVLKEEPATEASSAASDTQSFDFTVYLAPAEPPSNQTNVAKRPGQAHQQEEPATPPVVWGRGRGCSKVAAKQEAARQALLALAPGVVFDEGTGILVQLPTSTSAYCNGWNERSPTTATSMEDLAPNLAKQLAIGRDNHDQDVPNKRTKSLSVHTKRTLDVQYYPCTSTTSEEEDENVYYTSPRGASVCSALLHAMVQIDVRIPDPPEYTYGPAVPSTTATHAGGGALLKRKVNDSKVLSSAVRVTRGSFTCTARLRLLEPMQSKDKAETLENESGDSSSSNTSKCAKTECDEVTEYHEEGRPKASEESTSSTSSSTGAKQEGVANILEAIGLGGTKREARHVANAKLLALLFPECLTMVEVKAAAEAARERYAAGKAASKHLQQTIPSNRRHEKDSQEIALPDGAHTAAAMVCKHDDPPLPQAIDVQLRELLRKRSKPTNSTVPADASGTDPAGRSHEQQQCFRQLSRQKQVHALVESALQAMNELDEEGRCLPVELTPDDVGRTVLRRAVPEDLDSIRKLFGDGENNGNSSRVGASLWSSFTIVLLLCRAIAAYEDPPLGCAVLTFGFSMECGKTLRLAQIATESHLPRERMVECLQKFSQCLNCKLDTKVTASGSRERQQHNILTLKDAGDILDSYVREEQTRTGRNQREEENLSQHKLASPSPAASNSVSGVASSLQSVKEEEECADGTSSDETASSVEKRPAAKSRVSKPSKRSRVN